ncbi:MAG: SHOCT domain-containing protein [Flavobacteriales bacterium]|nr:SHOCT domain-containing protein [Flavobacteriales bacterium]
MKRTSVFSIALLIAFFMPWLDFRFITLSGFSIPQMLNDIGQLPLPINESDKEFLIVTYVLYLLPLLSIMSIASDFLELKNKNAFKKLDFYLGLVFSVIIILGITQLNERVFSFLGFGFYFTVIVSLIGVFVKDKPLFQPKEGVASLSIDYSQQLSQLKVLLDKELISQEEFDEKRKAVLNKMG